jgi:hypothetical protein
MVVIVCNFFNKKNIFSYFLYITKDTAYCKNEADKRWYCFNDSIVSVIDSKSVCVSSKYIL